MLVIIRKYRNKDDEILHKQAYKQTKLQEHFRIKYGVRRFKFIIEAIIW